MKVLKVLNFTTDLMRHEDMTQNRLAIQTLCLSLLLILLSCCHSLINNDTQTLIDFKDTVDVGKQLGSWGVGDPCKHFWKGVTCRRSRVIHLTLANLELHGSAHVLSSLDQLRILDLTGNSLNDSLPDVSNWQNLKFLYLSQNQFSGGLPNSTSSLGRLLNLDLSNNNLSGEIPASFQHFGHLLSLRLENNMFSGSIPPINLTTLQDFNVSGNQLSGNIPSSLERFGSSSFEGNSHLCGRPLSPCISSPTSVPSASSPSPISSTPKSVPISNKGSGSRLSKGAIVAIVLGDAAAIIIMTLLFLLYYWKRNTVRKPSTRRPEEQGGQYSLQVPEAERSRLVLFDGIDHPFELEDLLRASAEMLGKGSFGTAYKAVLESGLSVAVKRLKDVSISGRKEFEQHMELIGNLTHPNLVWLQAYCYAKEEKLLVYDYMPNGSLYSLLHGNRGPGRTPVDWTTRVKLALGAARGLTYIHDTFGSHKMAHGNIKSSNVLVDKDGNPRISDFGLALLMNTKSTPLRAGYRAPEQNDSRKISQRADVYSFGIVLLEILTGKAPAQSQAQDDGIDLPQWVQSVVREEWTAEVFDFELMRYKNIEEEMVAMLQFAMVCVSHSPEQRPKMSQVVKMIEDIRGDQTPSGIDSTGSQSRSPLSEVARSSL
ncbi:hypothetical protein O6H91_05G130300 [Diphasiastrum complanatum]|uniref:Uncharacterized protein n=4 Tax=Diphasiastrum complanatum TaxID=34168 RepID=A0ACC2DTE6_DIPCM|nr:hypothetical protein O6H91_05G032200 [Diphasiastrum complanatum]KAJ7555323.1 hypothetical protein O6H91_05G032200 [Diphasiastrum complanatum]KAJ7555324.1 hypothetical protein O6H91_05G032200 [Diphasiastrum complanatum]KAJ7557524.1 hypothetical protein O6H91_05G130300 [Diphasiastrum complanatum]